MIARAAVLFGCFVAGAMVIGRASHSEPTPIREPLAEFPMTLDAWRGVPEPPIDPQTLAVLGADDYLSRAYFRPGRPGVGLYIGYYKSQRQGDAIHSPLNCLPGSGWEPVSKSTLPIRVATAASTASTQDTGRLILVNRYVVQKGLDRQVVLYWYQSHGRIVASEYAGKVYLVLDAIRLNRTDAALVRVITPAPIDRDNSDVTAQREAVEFVQRIFPHLLDYLPL